MKKITKPKAPASKKSPKQGNPMQIVPGLLILAYILIPTFTPNLMSFDTNTPKFLALSLVNLLGFIFLLSSRQIRQQPGALGYFFKTWVGIVYSCFLVASLLSFINAINLNESLLQLTKLFCVFSAVYILSVILTRDLRYLKWIVLIFTGLLIFDSLSVFYYINEFIQGRIKEITDIKTVYSNKNILASAIYVKLPFALWLLMYGKRWLKGLGWFGLMTGITATFFMATRAFYLGLIILTVAFLAYMLAAYLREKQKKHISLAGSYLVALLVAYLAFTGTQQFLYPKSKTVGRLTQGVGQQLATISTVDASAAVRINFWEWSWILLKEKPLLGQGSGNWKVVVLKYENQQKEDFTYAFKAHNDFIETAAETGFIGGLLYLGIFALVAWAFLRQLFTRWDEQDDLFRYLFLAASGIAFYAVDAFFNFPIDRPEIQVLFSFYLATGISVMNRLDKKPGDEPVTQKPAGRNKRLILALGVLVIPALAVASCIFYLNFESSKLQRIAFQEIKSGKLKSPADMFLSGFPSVPNVSTWGEPISTIKARYLLKEDRNEEAIATLRADHSSPWDGRREYFMGMGFDNLKQPDSMLVYSEKALELKPKNFKHMMMASTTLEKRGEREKAASNVEAFLANDKTNNQAWVYGTQLYIGMGNIDKAWELIGEAKKYLPKDTLVEKQYKYLYQKKNVEPFRKEYTTAREYFDKKDYSNALIHLDKFIGNVPDDFTARRLRAYVYYYQGNYRESIDEINYAITLSKDTGSIFNLRGVCYRALKDLDTACKDFEKAMQMGDKDGKTNYERFCKGKSGN